MRIAKTLAPSRFFLGTLVVLVGCFSAAPTRVEAQCLPPSPGFNAVYGNCTGSASLQGTYALVDASQYQTSGDICQAIRAILNAYNTNQANGVLVDARGFPLPNGQNTYTCSQNPWSITAQPSSNVILLPSGTIVLTPSNGVNPTWTLPSSTWIIGQGPNRTIVQAASNFIAGGDMIDMGTPTLCPGTNQNCPAIKIEHLGLIGNANVANGIVNGFSQELSSVNDVALTNIPGIGLQVQVNASNSGPYSNITMSNVGTCVSITGASDTRGIHGLTCTTSALSTAAVFVDGNNNSIEDVYIQGGSSQDGILIGSNANAQGNLLFNVTGFGLKNVIHLSPANNKLNVSDITILGVTRSGGGTNTILDDLIGISITDANLGMYVLGEPVQGSGSTIGYSRFTTSASANAATWIVGPNSPGGNCAVGDLFSQTSGTGTTLWGCGIPTNGPGTGQWYSVK